MEQKKIPRTFGVIGLGRFGMALAKQLAETGREVIVLDRDEEKVKEIREITEHAYVCGKLTKEAMRDAGLEDCDVVAVCIGERLDTSILTALNALALGTPKVFAKATSPEHGMILEKLGVAPLFPEQEAAVWTARSMVSQNLLDYISISGDIEVAKIRIGEKLVGRTVAGVDFRKSFGLNIIALEHEEKVSTEVDAEYTFREGDVIVVIGKGERIRWLEEFVQMNM